MTNERCVSRDCRNAVRTDEPGPLRAGRGWSCGGYQNSSGGGIAATLDASYYKGTGSRNGKEREVIAVCMDNEHNSKKRKRKYIVRRLTPLECCRLQGFPDGWMDGVEGSDSAKYKAWGNSIAIPCADDVLGRITRELRNEKGSDTEHDND